MKIPVMYLVVLSILITQTFSLQKDNGNHKTMGGVNFRLLSSRFGQLEERVISPEIEVTFPNGEKDLLVLKHYDAFSELTRVTQTPPCSYIGTLRGERDARVAVSGCFIQGFPEEKMYITLLSKRSKHQKAFSLDMDGFVQPIQGGELATTSLDSARQDSDDVTATDKKNVDEDEIQIPAVEAMAKTVSLQTQQTVPYELNVKMKFGFDKSAKQVIESKKGVEPGDEIGSKIAIANWISEVFVHVKKDFHHPSLGHKINLEIVGDPDYDWLYYDKEYVQVGQEGLNELGDAKAGMEDSEVGLYMWIVDLGRGGGHAWVGGACNQAKRGIPGVDSSYFSKTGMAQGPSRQIVDTAESVTHEIGHLLGMSHDFKSHKQWCKKVFDGSSFACNKSINWNEAEKKLTALSGQEKEKAIKEDLGYCCTGLMDYGEHPQEWSYCSRRDFERHYISENWASCMPTVKECPDDKDGTQEYPAICSDSAVTNLGGTFEPVVPGVTTGPVVPTVDPVVPLAPHIDDAEVEPGWPYCDPENTFTEADKKEEKGDYDTRVGRNVATEQECIDLVLAKKPKANGMTWVKGGSKDCYAEINAHPGKWSRCGRGCNSCIFKGLLATIGATNGNGLWNYYKVKADGIMNSTTIKNTCESIGLVAVCSANDIGDNNCIATTHEASGYPLKIIADNICNCGIKCEKPCKDMENIFTYQVPSSTADPEKVQTFDGVSAHTNKEWRNANVYNNGINFANKYALCTQDISTRG